MIVSLLANAFQGRQPSVVGELRFAVGQRPNRVAGLRDERATFHALPLALQRNGRFGNPRIPISPWWNNFQS
jgi:hypothetical protein